MPANRAKYDKDLISLSLMDRLRAVASRRDCPKRVDRLVEPNDVVGVEIVYRNDKLSDRNSFDGLCAELAAYA